MYESIPLTVCRLTDASAFSEYRTLRAISRILLENMIGRVSRKEAKRDPSKNSSGKTGDWFTCPGFKNYFLKIELLRRYHLLISIKSCFILITTA